jgi:uncharacterized membrane protein YqjE
MSIEAGRRGGLLGSLRQLACTVVELVYTRLELFVTELDEERARLIRAAWLAAVGGFCLATAVLLLVLFIVVAFWDEHRLLVIGLFVLLFGAAGGASLLALRAMMGQQRQLFAQTLAELRADRHDLS